MGGVFRFQNAAIAQQQRVGPSARASEVLRERIAEPHMRAAFNLSGARFGVDRSAHIMSGDYTLNTAIFA